MKKMIKKIIISSLCLTLALTLVSCNKKVEELKEEISEDTTNEVIKQEVVSEEKKEEPVVEEPKEDTVIEEPKEEKKKQDVTKMYFWVVFYDQYDNELQREALKYGTVPEYKSWLPEGFDNWVYKKSGKEVIEFKPITGNTYFKAVCHEVYHEHHGSNEPAGPTISYTTIWEGNTDLGDWASSVNELSWGGYNWSTVAPGTILRTEFILSDGNQIRFGNGSWAALPGTKNFPEAEDGIGGDGNLHFPNETIYYEFELTQAMIDEMVSNGGLVISGRYAVITAVKLGVKS